MKFKYFCVDESSSSFTLQSPHDITFTVLLTYPFTWIYTYRACCTVLVHVSRPHFQAAAKRI